MPTGNLSRSVMTFPVISWASVFLPCEFGCREKPISSVERFPAFDDFVTLRLDEGPNCTGSGDGRYTVFCEER